MNQLLRSFGHVTGVRSTFSHTWSCTHHCPFGLHPNPNLALLHTNSLLHVASVARNWLLDKDLRCLHTTLVLAEAEQALDRLDGVLVQNGLVKLVHHRCEALILPQVGEVGVFPDLQCITLNRPKNRIMLMR